MFLKSAIIVKRIQIVMKCHKIINRCPSRATRQLLTNTRFTSMVMRVNIDSSSSTNFINPKTGTVMTIGLYECKKKKASRALFTVQSAAVADVPDEELVSQTKFSRFKTSHNCDWSYLRRRVFIIKHWKAQQ